MKLLNDIYCRLLKGSSEPQERGRDLPGFGIIKCVLWF